MCYLICFALMSCFLGIQGSRLPEDVIHNQDVGVVGGEDVPEGMLPYQVSLRHKRRVGSHFCGGSVLSNRWILTAAHCTFSIGRAINDIEVVVGTVNLVKGGTHYSVKKIINHEDYDDHKVINDISLIKVSRVIKFNDLVQPIRLPEKDTHAGTTLLLSGWGTTYYHGQSPIILQMLKLNALSVPDCQKRNKVPLVVSNKQICTLTVAGEGACHGDSGSPLVEFSSKTIVGIASWVEPCARGYPDVYTRVYAYKQWIMNNIFKHAMEETIFN